MATTLPDQPIGRTEQYLAWWAGQNVPLPDEPEGRIEHYLARICENN